MGWTLNNDDDGSPGGNSGEYFQYGDSVTIYACSSTSGTGDQEITISDGGGAFSTYNGVVSGSGCVSGYSFTANNSEFGDDWVASSGGNANIDAAASSWTSIFQVNGYSGPSLGNGGSTVTFGQDASFCLSFSDGNVGGDNWSGSGAPPGMGYDGNNCYSGTPSQAGSWSGSISDTEYDGAGNPYSTTGYWTVTANSSPPYWTSAPGSGSAVNGEYDGDVATFSAGSGDASGVSYGASGLPSGLGLSGGTIYGTPSASPGNYDATISAVQRRRHDLRLDHAHHRPGPRDHERGERHLRRGEHLELLRDDDGLPDRHDLRVGRASLRRHLHEQREQHLQVLRHAHRRFGRRVAGDGDRVNGIDIERDAELRQDLPVGDLHRGARDPRQAPAAWVGRDRRVGTLDEPRKRRGGRDDRRGR